uniref:Uncharacterized protein n=1 Tax=Magallana gigas TaxID=29159 RepID=K1P7G4_MAGGI
MASLDFRLVTTHSLKAPDNALPYEACEPPFEKLTNASSCYYISKDLVGGDEAFARCINIGGYLANFETLEEAMLMKQKLKKMNSGMKNK